MWFRNIPTTVEDFREKEKTWEGFEKALNVIGLNSKDVLARLQKKLPAYENMKTQGILCQKAYIEYSSEPNADVEEEKKTKNHKVEGKDEGSSQRKIRHSEEGYSKR